MSNAFPPDDELISAYLDGEVTPAERATIEADDASMARVAELRVVQEAVAAPVAPLSSADRARILAAALDASETSETVTSIGVARERRRLLPMTDLVAWGSRNRRPLIAVAAAVAVLALGVPLVRNLDFGGDATDSAEIAATGDDAVAEEPAEEAALAADSAAGVAEAPATTFQAEAAEPAAEPAEEPAEEAAEEPAEEPAEEAADEEGGDDSGIEFAPLVFDLGEFDSPVTLIEQVFESFEAWIENPLDAFLRAAGAETPPPPSCLEELMTEEGFAERHDDQSSDVGVAFVDGEPHEVWLFEDGIVYVAAIDTCQLIAQADFFHR
jgi:hypothetical protein